MKHPVHPEYLYLAAPCGTEAQRAFNEKIRVLLDQYAMTLSCPTHPVGEWALSAMSAVAKSKVLLAVIEPGPLDPWTAMLIGFAHAKHVPIVGILQTGASQEYAPLLERVVYVPAEDNHLAGPLINTINLYL